MKWDAELAERTREVIALVDRLRAAGSREGA